MQNINHGKYINYLILWRNSEIDAVLKAQRTEEERERRDKEERNAWSLKTLADYLMF